MALPQTTRFDNLLSATKTYLTPGVVRNASIAIGESEAATGHAMHSGIASVFAGLTNMASTSGGASSLGNLTREPAYSKLLNNVPSSFSGGSETSSLINSGQKLLGTIFGGRTSGVADAVAHSSGISSSSSGKLMAMVAPLAIGVLGKHAAARGLNTTGLANSLIGQSDEFAEAAPSGLSKLLAERAPTPAGIHVAPDPDLYRDQAPAATATVRTPERPTGRRWWPLLLIGIAILGLLFWLFRNIGSRTREAGRQAVTTTQNAPARIPPPATPNVPVPRGSINNSLASFLADGSQTAPKTFVFDHLNFETASTQLTADSQGTVTSLSQTLKAHPDAQVQLSGYTDNTGALDANQKLSLDRANAVKQMLVNSGIAADRIATTGHGQNRPIASNDTEDGRAKNRRLELTVTQK